MNEDEVRRLLGRAASGPVHVDRVDPNAIVRAGKRNVIRRRIGVAAAGTAAAAMALAAAVGIPLAFGDDRRADLVGDLPTQPVDQDFAAQWNRFDGGNCPVPDDQTEEQASHAASYNQSLLAGLAAVGVEPLGKCRGDGPDYDGLYGTDEAGTYFLREWVAFTGLEPDWRPPREEAWMTGAVWPTDDTEADQSQIHEEDCAWNDAVVCAWEDTDEGRLLLIEGTESSFVDPLTEEGGSREFPVVRAYLFREDVVVGLGFSVRFESAEDVLTAEQVAEVIKSIPVDEVAVGPRPSAGQIAYGLREAVEGAVPGLAVDAEQVDVSDPENGEYLPGDALEPGSFAFVRLGEGIADYGGPVYGSEGTHMIFLEAELGSGEPVLVYFQARRLGDDAGETDLVEEASSDAQCGRDRDDECVSEWLNPWQASVHRTIGGDRPSLAALEYDAGDGWLWGVGIESADGSELPPVDFEQLEDVLAHFD